MFFRYYDWNVGKAPYDDIIVAVGGLVWRGGESSTGKIARESGIFTIQQFFYEQNKICLLVICQFIFIIYPRRECLSFRKLKMFL